ncbi:hypothetical protein KSW81_006273 [Nannochloris sp. 'desiccata']|nr:hypothetical protein KSW81_006273 [Chlorella desiccata (nom. nud.)]
MGLLTKMVSAALVGLIIHACVAIAQTLTDPDVPATDFAHQGPEFSPDQVRITLWTPTSMLVSWASGVGKVGPTSNPPAPYNVNYIGSQVQYGREGNKLSKSVTGRNDGKLSKRVTYTYRYSANSGPINDEGTVAVSPIFHHVLLKELRPGKKYYYRVGSKKTGFSKVFNFIMPENKYPFTFGVFGDLGQRPDSLATVKNLAAKSVDAVLSLGDQSYVDAYWANGTYNCAGVCSYQPRWDIWNRMMQQLSSKVPTMTIVGCDLNHELELMLERGGLLQASHNARFPGPQNPDIINTDVNFEGTISKNRTFLPTADTVYSNNSFWAVTIGPARVIALSNAAPYGPDSVQYKFLERELENVDRKRTPWVITVVHGVWYSSFVDHFKENDEMRKMVEPLLYKHGVDVVLNAHAHSYERNTRMYEWEANECAPLYILNGQGGFPGEYEVVEKDPPPFCETGVLKIPPYQPTYSGKGYIDPTIPRCFSTLPDWSKKRMAGQFGHSVLTLIDDQTLEWKMYLNDNPDVPYDRAIVTKPTGCSNISV